MAAGEIAANGGPRDHGFARPAGFGVYVRKTARRLAVTTKQHRLVLAERSGAVLTLTLNRPEKSNAFHPDLLEQLAGLVADAREDPEIAVMIVTGAGRSFCAGLDLDLLATWGACEKLDYLSTAMALFRGIWE